MDIANNVLQLILHSDQTLALWIAHYGLWMYAVLFLIIFCESGLIVTPFLPGDSLLFAVGALCAGDGAPLSIHGITILLIIASIIGGIVNYWVGRFIGPRVFQWESSWLFNKQYLEKSHRFFERHGGKTIFFARFIPIIRTFAPFVAGVGYMSARRFFFYNFFSGLIWVAVILYLSYSFGNLPAIHKHFTWIILAIMMVSCFPPAIGFISHRLAAAKSR